MSSWVTGPTVVCGDGGGGGASDGNILGIGTWGRTSVGTGRAAEVDSARRTRMDSGLGSIVPLL